MGKAIPLEILLTIILIICIISLRKVEPFFNLIDNNLFEIPHYVPRRIITPTSISGVPTVIYNSWHSNKVPPKMKENIYSLIDNNREFDYYLYSDDDSAKYIEEHFSLDVLNAFHVLKPGAFKSDLWRYCILYKKGGVYIDIKFNSIMPLRDLIKETPEVYVKDMGADGCFYNGFMISPPNNNIFKRCIDEIVENCMFKLYKESALSVTGPCLFGNILKIHNYSYWINPIYSFERAISKEGIICDYIMNKEKCVLSSYLEYRDEQRLYQKTEHYGKMWADMNIFN
jgi:mannosyltransferase OCH1-like enzyme